MGLHGCNITCNLDASNFSKPMPWIGIYIAAASLACSLAMGMDTFSGFRRRKLWFPCKWFSLNATSLTLLSITTKLPLDLNTSMPSRQDQLTKLTGTVLICTAMGNFMTSLGTMDDSEILSNVVALGILVITVIVNVGIQMGTGVIYVFWPEHAVIMFFMLILLVILVSSALTVATAKKLLDQQYDEHTQASREGPDEVEMWTLEKLKEKVKKYWMMAHTSSPQYVLGRSATSTATGAFCLLSALILLEAMVRSLIPCSLDFCQGESDYKWSTMLVLISQLIAVGIATIAPTIRWYNAIRFRQPTNRSHKNEFDVEKYWVERLEEWKENPLPVDISSERCRKLAHYSKNLLLHIFIGMQTAIVLACKFICLASIRPVTWLSSLLCGCKGCWRKAESNSSETGSLKDFVLHLEGEGDLVHLIMKNGCLDMEQWIQRGRKNKPIHLTKLLDKSTLLKDFKGLPEFDSDRVSPVPSGGEKPPNCWALPVVTLASIVVAVPYGDRSQKRSLKRAIDEGLKYVRLVEHHLDAKGLSKMREAADIVWSGIHIHNQWLNQSAIEGKDAEEIIKKFVDKAKNLVSNYDRGKGREKQSRDWPAKIWAAISMYRIGQTILQDYEKNFGTVDRLFGWLQTTIADILGACLTNLPQAISMECICCAIEVREERVREAAYILGQAETILKDFGEKTFKCLDSNSKNDIDKWLVQSGRNSITSSWSCLV